MLQSVCHASSKVAVFFNGRKQEKCDGKIWKKLVGRSGTNDMQEDNGGEINEREIGEKTHSKKPALFSVEMKRLVLGRGC